MKVVIPAAGTGERLFPHTYSKPKPMVSIAGKPIIGHILDRMGDLKPEEIIIIVGYKKEQIISYIKKHYPHYNITFVEQRARLGLGHSIHTVKKQVDSAPIMIALGDMIFKAGYSEFYKRYQENGHCDGAIGVWEVDEPQKYGIVEEENNCIKSLEEKPEHPRSNLAIAGVYFIHNTPLLFKTLDHLITHKIKTRGEYQLTDALTLMIQHGAVLKTFPVSSWYDCGHAESLLETNKVLLDEINNTQPQNTTNHHIENSIIIPPVSLGENAHIKNSVIGPHTSIAENTTITNSIISNSIIGANTTINNVNLQASIVGDDAIVSGKHNSLNIGDNSTIEF
jgi:glucose-1-phosphate thymidylyltransferase